MQADIQIKFNDIDNAINILKKHLNWENSLNLLSEYNSLVETPNFWNNTIKAQSTMKEKKQLEIKGKILERSGYDEVMHTDKYDGTMTGMNASQSEMGSIKENIETKMNR